MATVPHVLTSYDDYPIHQASVPIAHTAAADLNHYDRYFFNGYSKTGDLYFAAAMGLYPNRHVADAAFCVVRGGVQTSVFRSQRAPVDRIDATNLGPIKVEIVEPLRTLRISVDAPEQGVRAELTFEHRSPAIEEGHFLLRAGVRVLFDYTRLTQFGDWHGWVELDGSQDLIVHIIARGRYEVANRANVTIPTNLDVKTAVQPVFGAFYADLVDRTFKKNPTAAITEFAWQGALPPPEVMVESGIYGVTCDPCPPPHPMDDPLARFLGADVLPGIKSDAQVAKFAREATVTRLHLRYTKDSLTDDLVFNQVEPIHGGIPGVAKPEAAKTNRFQGRSVMWKRGGMCMGGGFGNVVSSGLAGTSAVMSGKTKLTRDFAELLVTDIPELDLVAKGKTPPKK